MSERPREMPAISNLARLALEQQSPLLQGLTKALANPYDVVDNPTGIINLGTAENQLMFPELLEKVFTFNRTTRQMNALMPDDYLNCS